VASPPSPSWVSKWWRRNDEVMARWHHSTRYTSHVIHLCAFLHICILLHTKQLKPVERACWTSNGAQWFKPSSIRKQIGIGCICTYMRPLLVHGGMNIQSIESYGRIVWKPGHSKDRLTVKKSSCTYNCQ
jgi:hypothetical protein